MCWVCAVYSQTRVESAGQDRCFSNALHLPESCLKGFHTHALLQLDINERLQPMPKCPRIDGSSEATNDSRLLQPAYPVGDCVRTEVYFGSKLFKACPAML